MKRILCLIRTSTLRQEIDSQKSDMADFLQSKGYAEDEIEWLEAKGASARCVNKSYLEMLDTIKSTILGTPTIKACACWHLNRLGRVESYITTMREWFIANKIQLYVKNPELTLLNADGSYNTGNNIIFAVFAATIPAETEEMMAKMKRGKDAAKAKGKYIGGFVTTGFKIENGYQVVDPEQMELVKLIFREYATGKYSYYKLQNELHSRNLPFTVRHLALLLANEIYKNFVGEDLWNKCKMIRENNKWAISKESVNSHLLNKMIKCEYCGATFITDRNIYVCLNRKQGKRYGTSCKNIVVRNSIVEPLAWEYSAVRYLKVVDELKDENIKELEENIIVLDQKIKKKNADLEKINEKLKIAKAFRMDAEISQLEYEKRKEAVQAEEKLILSSIEALEDERKHSIETIDLIKSGASALELTESVDEDKKKEVIKKIIKKITVSRGKLEDGRDCTCIKIYPFKGDLKCYYVAKNDIYMDSRGKIVPYPKDSLSKMLKVSFVHSKQKND